MERVRDFSRTSDLVDAEGTAIECLRFEGGLDDRSRTLLLLPGFAATAACFARQHPLAAVWDLRCITLPESRTSAGHAIHEFGDLIGDVASAFDRPVLMGTSFSGLVAIDAASRMPERFSGVILVSTYARWSAREAARNVASWLAPLIVLAGRSSGEAMARFAGGPALDDEAIDEFQREAQSLSARERRRRLHAAFNADVTYRAAAITLPALVIHGTDDHLVPLATGRELAHLIVNSRFRTIDGAGHVPYVTHAAEFNHIVDDFLFRIAWDRDVTRLRATSPVRERSAAPP